MGKFEPIGSIQPFLKLQEGEWADVYKAYDASLESNVLLKRVKAELQDDVAIASRFEGEVELMTRVDHPNVVRVLASGRHRQLIYFVAEFVEGLSLSDLLASGRLPVLLATYVLRETSKGLHAAHTANILHRDIKPANILISDEGAVKLADFGMASPVETPGEEELRGTLGYLAPELLFEGEPSTQSDLFALGATFYKMLTGLIAFKGASSSEIIDQLVNYDPLPSLAVNPEIPSALVRICAKLLDKEPENRYTDCLALIHDIDHCVAPIASFNGGEELARYIIDPEAYATSIAYPVDIDPIDTDPVDPDPILQPPPEPVTKESQRVWQLVLLSAAVLSILLVFVLTRTEPEVDGEERAQANQSAVQIDSTVPFDTTQGIAVSEETPDSLAPHIAMPPAESDTAIAVLEPAQNASERDVPAIDENTLDETPVAEGDAQEVLPAGLQTGLLDIMCTPHCTVVIDGDSVGTAPPAYTDSLMAGVYNVQLIHPALPVYITDVVITAGRAERLRIPLKDYIGSVELSVWPYADVFIDGVAVGRVPPVKSFNLRPGQHTIKLVHDILGTRVDTLLVVAGEKHRYTYNMREP